MEDKVEKFVQVPRCDIVERQDALRILLDMPGVSSDKLNVEVKERVMSVRGESSLVYGSRPVAFERAFELAPGFDGENIAAKLKDGVLELTLPKVTAQPRRIPIVNG